MSRKEGPRHSELIGYLPCLPRISESALLLECLFLNKPPAPVLVRFSPVDFYHVVRFRGCCLANSVKVYSREQSSNLV